VKRTSRKRAVRKKPSVHLFRQQIQHLVNEHQMAWHEELMKPSPYWTHLLALHLRLVELENLESGMGELL
jgi:hypothetical protein